MRSDSSGPMPASGSSSSSTLRLARQRHGDLELALLAVRQRAGDASGHRRRPTRATSGIARSIRSRSLARPRAAVPSAGVPPPALPRRTFSSTRQGRARCWCAGTMRPMPSLRHAPGRLAGHVARPPASMRPGVGAISPDSRLTSVDLPAPFGPMTACSSPGAARSTRRARPSGRRNGASGPAREHGRRSLRRGSAMPRRPSGRCRRLTGAATRPASRCGSNSTTNRNDRALDQQLCAR